ncbi:hypothetical protein TNCV_4263161 [Trichonephila clavipes]|nr:hypothetical protein TNCV_4263161 [Trichonephila clavipes]
MKVGSLFPPGDDSTRITMVHFNSTLKRHIFLWCARLMFSAPQYPAGCRKMFKNCRKEDLRIVTLELGETVAEKVTIVELTETIKENKYFKEDVEFLKELIQYKIQNRKKAEEDRKKEAENRLREKELEL